MKIFRTVLLAAAALYLAGAMSGTALENPRALRELPGPRCKVQSFNLNAIRSYLDGQWQGMLAASDGRVYFAASTHSGHNGGAVLRYDPAAGKLELLVPDITLACGEDPAVNPQGKMHSDFIEHRGWIYFATHFSSEYRGARQTYTGAHVLGLEMATGKTRDFGVLHPGYTIYSGIGVDRGRDRIFAVTEPIYREQAGATNGGTRIYALEIKSGARQDLGVLNQKVLDSSSSFFVAPRGDCWFSLRSAPGALYRVDAETLKIARFADALPKAGEDAWENANAMIWSRPIGDGSRCVLLKGDRWLWQFDSSRPLAEAFTRLAEIGPAGLGTALAGNKVFFVRSADAQGRGGGRYFDKRDDHHLYSVALDGKEVTDHGLIEDADGRRPWRIHSLAADGAGRVFMTGDWYCKTPTEGMRRYAGEKDGKPVYEQLRRGLFFAVWDPAAKVAAGK